jgi:chromosomal replication initiation ATPase DnaA
LNKIPSQLTLAFPRAAGFAAEDLLPNPAQDEARAWLEPAVAWPLRRLALWGPAGSGKSHLAHVWAQRSGGVVLPAAPAGGWPRRPIALDAIDAVPDEPALLYLLNAAAESGQPVLLVSRTAPGRLPVRLPDLASRLRATTAVQIGPADDAFLAMLLARLLSDRQVRVAAPVQTWLLTNLPRSPAAIRDAVARLDAAALSARRPITRPLAAEVLGLCDTSVDQAYVISPPPQDLR